MNCRSVRGTINERDLGRLSPDRALALATHLRRCPACSSSEQADRWIVDELASLRGPIVGLGVITLLALLWGSWPEWRTGMENGVALLRGLADVSTTLAALLISLLSIPFRLFVGLRDLWATIPSVASGLKPFAIVGVALCYLIMASTVVGVVGRDLRHPVSTPNRED